MVVVKRFLHQIRSGPKQSEKAKAQTVAQSDGHKQAANAHDRIVNVHSNSRQRLQPFKTDVRKSEFWSDEISRDPSAENIVKTLPANQNAKYDPEKDELGIVCLPLTH